MAADSMRVPADGGRFHPGRPVGDHLEPLTCWRVVTRHPHVAREVARILGHTRTDTKAAAGGSTEVTTASSRVRIVVSRIHRTGVVFRLAKAPRLGEFSFTSGVWDLAHSPVEMKRLHAAAQARVPGVLELARVIHTTRCGRSVLYARPRLQIASPSASAPADQRF